MFSVASKTLYHELIINIIINDNYMQHQYSISYVLCIILCNLNRNKQKNTTITTK